MFSKKSIVMVALMIVFAFSVFEACAQWTPMKTEISLGGFKLDSSKTFSVPEPSLMDNLLMNNSSLNNTALNNTSIIGSQAVEAQPIKIVDLSNYAKDRSNKSLTGYVNVMYPLAETSGFTATTGGSGGGCGCG